MTAATFAISTPAWSDAMRRETLVISTSTGKANIAIEVAVTGAEQEQGLMFRTSMPDNAGMLFVYNIPRTIQMWMHNTYISLDMVFIQADGSVSRIEDSADPLSDRVISSGKAAKAVLELKAGTARRLNLQPGDHIESPSLR